MHQHAPQSLGEWVRHFKFIVGAVGVALLRRLGIRHGCTVSKPFCREGRRFSDIESVPLTNLVMVSALHRINMDIRLMISVCAVARTVENARRRYPVAFLLSNASTHVWTGTIEQGSTLIRS